MNLRRSLLRLTGTLARRSSPGPVEIIHHIDVRLDTLAEHIDVRLDTLVKHIDDRYSDLRERIEMLRQESQANAERDRANFEFNLDMQSEWAALTTRVLSELGLSESREP